MLKLMGPAHTYTIIPDLRNSGYRVGVWFGPFASKEDARAGAEAPLNAAYLQGGHDAAALLLERLRALGRHDAADQLRAEWRAANPASGKD